jgi:hypothetical protein
MESKRPIDRIRNSAVSMIVGGPDDPSPIVEMLPIEGIMHFVKEKSIYACKLADNIDPERTNPHIPNVQQKVLAIGSDSLLVGRTLLTAKQLFHEHFLPASFDCKAALALTFDALKNLAAMQTTAEQIQTDQAASNFEDRRRRDRSVVLPTIGDALTISKSFIQKADHVLQGLLGIVKLFYGDNAGKVWFESLAELAHRHYGPEDQFSKFLAEALPLFQFVRNARNCVEHPKPSQCVVVTDFTLNSAMQIVVPTIEIIHPKSQQVPISIELFMHELIEQISGVFELMIAFMCAKHAQPLGGFSLGLMEVPEAQRRSKHVRFSYCTNNGMPVLTPG